MSDRKSLKIDAAVYDRLADAKGSQDTWNEFLSRLLNSVQQDQVHFDRATLEDFGEDTTEEIKIKASSEGELEIQFYDESDTQIGASMLSTLDPEQEIRLSISKGEEIQE